MACTRRPPPRPLTPSSPRCCWAPRDPRKPRPWPNKRPDNRILKYRYRCCVRKLRWVFPVIMLLCTSYVIATLGFRWTSCRPRRRQTLEPTTPTMGWRRRRTTRLVRADDVRGCHSNLSLEMSQTYDGPSSTGVHDWKRTTRTILGVVQCRWTRGCSVI